MSFASYDVSNIFSLTSLCDISPCEETVSEDEQVGIHQNTLSLMREKLQSNIRKSLATVSDVPSVIVASRMCSVWNKVIDACSNELVSVSNVKRVLKDMQKEEDVETSTAIKTTKSLSGQSVKPEEKRTGNALLVELGIKAGLSIVFTLLKQAWSQFTWQKQLEEALLQSSISLGPIPAANLPNEVMRSVYDVLVDVPPLSLSNPKTISQFGQTCVDQSAEFLQWVISPSSQADAEGKRLGLQIMISLCIQRGSLVYILEWVEKILLVLVSYGELGVVSQLPTLEVSFCRNVLNEISKRGQIGSGTSSEEGGPAFPPEARTLSGHVNLMDFLQSLMKELSSTSHRCTNYFSENDPGRNDFFISQSSEVYAFGSNSSSQLAVRSSDKFHAATLMSHMEDAQVVVAGHYCSFLIYSDGSVKVCGKGSYGRLGLGHNELQSTLQQLDTFPAGVEVRSIASSKGSDGHSMAITAQGQVYSWGDGNCWKLGHGTSACQRVPKLITALTGKVVKSVACGNKHSAAITDERELYTWGEGDYGRLGHGNSTTCKVPTKVEAIGAVRQVACGETHTLALSADGKTIWSFGNGEFGRLGHGDTARQSLPKVIESLQGTECQRVCAANQFSLVLVGGKVYSFGKGSGLGQGADARAVSPTLIEPLEKEVIIDITTGDGHCLALTKKGEVYSWGTNSMGQCGHGHSNGSIVKPAKVLGLDSIQVQQIAAGTSHSVVWTALPCNRHASALWHWPYCISIGENTIEKLLSMLNRFSDFSGNPVPPFHSIESQQSFVLSLLTLLRTHLSVVASVGPDSVQMACGGCVKPLRDLLFKLIDSQLPPALDEETSIALEVGASVLLPPIHDRLDMLLAILPEEPSSIVGLTTGQRLQLDILLSGFSSRSDFVGIFAHEVVKISENAQDSIDLLPINKLFELNHRMVGYLHKATLFSLQNQPLPPDIRLGCPLLNKFQEFITSTFINVFTILGLILNSADTLLSQRLPSHSVQLVIHHVAPFDHLMGENSLSILEAIREAAAASENPAVFLCNKKHVLFGFLAYQYPCHIALSIRSDLDQYCNTVDVLLEAAKSVHQLVALLPSHVVTQLEQEELLWERKDDNALDLLSLRDGNDPVWRQLLDYERLLCYCSGKLIHRAYMTGMCTSHDILQYCPAGVKRKGQTKNLNLLSSHLLSNGAVGGMAAIATALYEWVSLCKTLPGISNADCAVKEEDPPTISSWSTFLIDYNFLLKTSCKDDMLLTHRILEREADMIEPMDFHTAPVLHCLAVGTAGNEIAAKIYSNMMEYANQKDWNTCSDEEAVPELKQVSCAALACLIKHTGLLSHVINPNSNPKKKLTDVYRHVFSLRHEVFTHRPIPDSEGVVSDQHREVFRQQCSGVCVTLMLLMCVLEPAIPEETNPLIPRKEKTPICPSSAKSVGNKSPGFQYHPRTGSGTKRPFRLFSQTSSQPDEKSKVPPLTHSTSVGYSSQSHQDISLSGVKQALSMLRWQRDRLDHLEASSGTAYEGSFHLTICSTLLNIVSQVFNDNEDGRNQLLNRVDLIKVLLCHQYTAENRKKYLSKMLEFVESCDSFLPSSRVIFKGICVEHNMHYSDHISVAPSVLQHEVKSLSHKLVQLTVNKLFSINTTDLLQLSDSSKPSIQQLAIKRELMLALQWINFKHHATDLQFFFTEELYSKIAELSCVPSTEISVLPSLPSSTIWHSLQTACASMTQLLALQIGLNADVLRTSSSFLQVVSKHLFGQLQCFIATEDPEVKERWKASSMYSLNMREELLGDFLKFLNHFSTTHATVRVALASDQWFTILLKAVDVDIVTGVPVIPSVKVRLLVLEVLGTIMSGYSVTDESAAQAKCTKIVEDLLELLFRCMFVAPATSLQHVIDDSEPLQPDPSPHHTTTIPFTVDPDYQHAVTCVTEVDGCLLARFDSSVRGHFIGLTPLTVGKYLWKVTVESASTTPNFVVGVSHKPLADSNIETSNEIWAISHRGSIFHAGEMDHCIHLTLTVGSSLELQYNANSADGNTGTLLCDYGTGYMVVHGVSKSGRPVYPVFMFPQDDETAESNPVTVRFHPIVHSQSYSFADFRRREQLASGYPHLSPTNATLSQAVVSLLHQVQDKKPWDRSIGLVISSKLSELDSLIHHLLSIEEQLASTTSSTPDRSIVSSLSLLITRLTQVVWPAMAVIGGLDSGFCLGSLCGLEGGKEAVIVSIPDSELNVVVEEMATNTARTRKKRTIMLSDLNLTSQSKFSVPLIAGQLSPSILLNLAHLAGSLDQHSIPAIFELAHSKLPGTKEMLKCLQYQLYSHSVVQMAATKSLFTILLDQSVIQLLTYQPPSLETAGEGACEDKSELVCALKEVLKCLYSQATKPSPLNRSLKLLELQKLHSTLSNEALTSIAEYLSCRNLIQDSSSTLVNFSTGQDMASEATIELQPSRGSLSSFSYSNLSSESASGLGESGLSGRSGAEASRTTTPPIALMLMDMGFTRPHVNVALERCPIPENTDDQAKLPLLVSWIIDHPDIVAEEEVRLRQVGAERDDASREKQRVEWQYAHQTAAADEFLSRIEALLNPDPHNDPGEGTSGEQNLKTIHAADLLEGPDCNEEIPDISLVGVDDSPHFLKPLLSALGISQQQPIPNKYIFHDTDPMGEASFNVSEDGAFQEMDSHNHVYTRDGSPQHFALSSSCDDLMAQTQRLKSMEETLSALNRIASAAQILVARHVALMLIASLTTQDTKLVSTLKSLDLFDIKSLVRLLRLVDAGCIDGTPGESLVCLPSNLHPVPALHCLSSALASIVTDQGPSAGLKLMQSCSRDLLMAAVGGAELIQKSGRWNDSRVLRNRGGKSDVSTLANPNFKVSQRLVKILVQSTGKLVSSDLHMSGVMQMMDALAACLFSTKLDTEQHFWALQQLVGVFAMTGANEVVRKEKSPSQKQEDLITPSKLEHLDGHKGQIMACVENTKERRLLTIGEDNCVLRWNLRAGLAHVDVSTFPLPPVSQSMDNDLFLPVLCQNSQQNCVAGAIGSTLCVWKVKDGKSVVHKFPELITTIQFKPAQSDGDLPVILVGLVDGNLALAHVHKVKFALTPEIEPTTLTSSIHGAVTCMCWSPDGAQFAVGSTTGQLQLFRETDSRFSLVTEMEDSRHVRSICWSPNSLYLTVLDEHGVLQMWSVPTNTESVAILMHSFDAWPTHCVQWHSLAARDGTMLLASGAKVGTVHLWLVGVPGDGTSPSTSKELVSHLASLEGHPAPITKLVFCESASLLASGCKAGSIRIWDIAKLSLLKLVTRVGAGEVIDLTWTEDGLVACYNNTYSLYLLPPGPGEYLGERSLLSCLPLLHHYSIMEPSKAPCLTAFIKNLHRLLLTQYQYEQVELTTFKQLVHSEYMQLLTALTMGLGLHTPLLFPPSPPHLPTLPTPKEWKWLVTFTSAIEMAESLSKRTPLKHSSFILPAQMKPLDSSEKFQPSANNVWSMTMDRQILEWISQRAEDWWPAGGSTVYTWGNGTWNQLGHASGDNVLPAPVQEWKDIQQVVAGSYCTYGVKYDGSVCSIGEGSFGRLGHGGSDNESSMRVIGALQGIPVVHVVAGPRVSTYTEEGFALALTHFGDVYSWGKGYKGRLGHSTAENIRTPKIIDALSKDIKMISCCDYHSAAVTVTGCVLTFGSKENGKLGRGRDSSSGSLGRVGEVTKFFDVDKTTQIPNVKIGHVSCGQMFTLAITEDGSQVFGWGEADHCSFGSRDITGDHFQPVLLAHLTQYGPFTKVVCGHKSAALLTVDGRVYRFGKVLSTSIPAELVPFPDQAKVVDLATAASYHLALTENGDVFYWGKYQFGDSISLQRNPLLIENLSGKGIKQISAGVCHCTSSNTILPSKGVSNITVPSSIPAQFTELKGVSCEAIYARLMLLNHFSKLISDCWPLFFTKRSDLTNRFHVNPLSDETIRLFLSPVTVEGLVSGAVGRTMTRKSHGPTITIQRINTTDNQTLLPMFPQIAPLILQKNHADLRCPSRAWKVNLVGEGADDAGGVFDETMAQMCEEMESGVVNLLIPTPNATNKCGFNTDRFVLNPQASVTKDYNHLKFLGILLGVAMRTRKPLDLHLARPMWKLLAGMSLTPDDLEEVDLLFIQTLYGIRDVHKSGVKEDDFSVMIPIESYEAQSMSGKFVPIVPGGTNIKLTFQNRKDYVEKALHFRLHELDGQVAVIRQGLSCIVPVPLFSLYTAKMLQHAVCGMEQVDLSMLKKVVRYKDGTTENHDVIRWLWQTLETFTNEEKILFLRFVSGRSRLPVRISDIPQRFRISVYGQYNDSLPTSQTCFFQLRLPNYPSQEMLCDRLRYAIRNCRSIDMDNYMLRRSASDVYDSDEDDDDDDD